MSTATRTDNCAVCGSRLDYLQQAEQMTCSVCRQSLPGNIRCVEGHFVCAGCHGQDVLPAIQNAILCTKEKDPVHISEQLLALPALPMLGCEHAFIAAGALMAALRNSPYAKITDTEIREVFARTARQSVGGSCGLTGVCGIAPAIGACFSVFLEARCGSDTEQRLVMDAVIKVSQEIARLTGPSCCKAYVRAAVAVAVEVCAERFGMALPVARSPLVCDHSSRHPHGCREEKCPYYQKPSRDIFAESIHLKTTVCHS